MFKLIRKKLHSLKTCLQFGEYDKIIAAILGKKISLFTNTLKPQRYKYVMLASHGTGRNAFWHFLQACGAAPMRKFDICIMDKLAFFSWQKIYGIVCDRDISHLLPMQIFLSKLTHKVPVFCLVRDPISIIRGGVNGTLAKNLMGGGAISVCIKSVLESYLQAYSQMRHHFIFNTSPIQFAPITSELIYIDMEKLSSQNAYHTMSKVCEKISLPIPPNKELFTKKIADPLALNIEKDFLFSKNNIFPCDIYIKILPYENTLHKKFTFLIKEYSSSQLKGQVLSICLLNKFKLKNFLLKDQKIIKTILQTIENHTQIIKENFIKYEQLKINENDVLKYFKNDVLLWKKFKDLLEYEVSNIKETAPQILENWVYYQEFLTIKHSHTSESSELGPQI